MKTHNGKIARLPRDLRDELNQRLENGEPEGLILPWLNALPEVQAVLAAQFCRRPVNPQNLTNWRHGGYRDWLKQQEHRHLVRDVARDAKALADTSGQGIAGHVSTLLVAELAVAARKLPCETATPGEKREQLRGLLKTVCQVRHEEYLSGRLGLDREIVTFKNEVR